MRCLGQGLTFLILAFAYVLRTERRLSDFEYDEAERLLPEERRRRLRAFRDRADSERGLLGDFLARHAICAMADIPLWEQIFVRNEHGKPMLENAGGVYFNVSHSGRYVVCAVDHEPIGIDVEETAPIDLKIADRFFSGGEKKYILDVASNEGRQRFFEVWTMKESFIKRTGEGLSVPLPSFDVFELAGKRKAFFHKALCNDEAICHVCTTYQGTLECAEVVPGELGIPRK